MAAQGASCGAPGSALLLLRLPASAAGKASDRALVPDEEAFRLSPPPAPAGSASSPSASALEAENEALRAKLAEVKAREEARELQEAAARMQKENEKLRKMMEQMGGDGFDPAAFAKQQSSGPPRRSPVSRPSRGQS